MCVAVGGSPVTRLRCVAAGAVALVERTGIGHYSIPASVLAVVDDENVALVDRTGMVALVDRTGMVALVDRTGMVALVDRTGMVALVERTGMVALVERTGIGHYSRPGSVLAVVDDEQVALEIVVAVDAEWHIGGNVAAEWRN